MNGMMGPTRERHRRTGFTLIEMLTVIAIIMVVMGLALPNFMAMMKDRRWAATISSMQAMVWRARAIATNVRKDMSVEFDIQGDNGTAMWLESEMNGLESLPDLNWLQVHYPSYHGFRDQILTPIWSVSGGTYDSLTKPDGTRYYGNFRIDYSKSRPDRYGDNARQSETVRLGYGLTIDDRAGASPDFVNWDDSSCVTRNYGGDLHKDIRIGPNGALVQTKDPVITIRQIRGEECRRVRAVRCTGRLVAER